MAKPHIVMFRTESERHKMLAAIVKRDNIPRIRSTNLLARKIVDDYLDGRLSYAKPEDQYKNHTLGAKSGKKPARSR